MPQYVCKNCKQRLNVATGRRVFKYTEKRGKKTIVVRCPKCGTDNAFEIPDK